jgi:cell division protein FtsI/penicillin-binding protein 2
VLPSVEEPSARAVGQQAHKGQRIVDAILKDMKRHVQCSHLTRLHWMSVLFILTFLGLAGRLVHLQVFKHAEYGRKAQQNTHRLFLQEPHRGEILDINGHPFASSSPMKEICADPYFIGPYAHLVSETIGPALDWNISELAARLQPCGVTNKHGKVVPKRYVDLKRKITPEQWESLTQSLEDLRFPINISQLPRKQRIFFQTLRQKAVFAVDQQSRLYPNGALAAHVLGFVQAEEQDFNDVSVTEIVGRSGVESWFQPYLAGARGWRMTEIDGRSQELVAYREQDVKPRPGLNVVLTLDLIVQGILEKELSNAMHEFKPLSASGLVVRPRTGEILALASLPSFDPSQPGLSPIDHLRNRVISDQMEPGSTFKIVVISAAINEGLVQLTDPIDCEHGVWYYKGRPLHDAHPHDILTVLEVLSKSSNIGAAKIALLLGPQRLYDYVRAFGFDQKTGITLPGEISGEVLAPKDWDGLTITRMPMGQSVAVTHLQMAMAMCAIANGGWLMRPMLVRRLVNAEGQVFADYPPQQVRRVISTETAQLITSALKQAVSEEGTGARAMLDHYQVAGKTGTAQVPIPGGYLHNQSVHSFIGFLPADDPEICISVVLERPQHGRFASGTAAPTFRNIAELTARHLCLRPDRVTPELAAPDQARPEKPFYSTQNRPGQAQ